MFLKNFKNPCWLEKEIHGMNSSYKNGFLRCLPYFHLFGVCKSGTTDLFSRLTQHPQILENFGDLHKETTFWSWGRYGKNGIYLKYIFMCFGEKRTLFTERWHNAYRALHVDNISWILFSLIFFNNYMCIIYIMWFFSLQADSSNAYSNSLDMIVFDHIIYLLFVFLMQDRYHMIIYLFHFMLILFKNSWNFINSRLINLIRLKHVSPNQLNWERVKQYVIF